MQSYQPNGELIMKVQIPLSIETALLKQVEDTKGENRSQKIVKLIELGLQTFCDHPHTERAGTPPRSSFFLSKGE
jgi:hypothetical protein